MTTQHLAACQNLTKTFKINLLDVGLSENKRSTTTQNASTVTTDEKVENCL
jgi:hypothetical protein